MTDKDALYLYRIEQAKETLFEAKKMIESSFSTRSIINRAYYSMFYALLALLIKTDTNISTSKHTGTISLFDKEFVKTGKVDKKYSKMLHDAFDARLEVDYKEFIDFPVEEATELLDYATDFIQAVSTY